MWVSVIFFNKKWTRSSPVSPRGPAEEACSLTQVRETENSAQVQFASGLPEERSGVDFGTRLQSLPTNPAFFPDMLAQDLTGELGKKKKKKERGKNSPRAGGRYCMHVHSSTRFVASCLRIFFWGVKIIHTVNRESEREGESCLLPVQLNSTGGTERHCQLCFFKFCFFLFLRPSQ